MVQFYKPDTNLNITRMISNTFYAGKYGDIKPPKGMPSTVSSNQPAGTSNGFQTNYMSLLIVGVGAILLVKILD